MIRIITKKKLEEEKKKPIYMGHFTIELPENKLADVRFGTVSKMHFALFKKKKDENWSKKGYIIKIADDKNQAGYRLFISKNGQWSTDEDGKNPLNSGMLISIQRAIIEKEKELGNQ